MQAATHFRTVNSYQFISEHASQRRDVLVHETWRISFEFDLFHHLHNHRILPSPHF